MQNQTALTLHHEFTKLVRNERQSTHEVLLGIVKIDSSKAYLDLGFGSLFDYLTLGQSYEEGSAQRRISAARLLKEIPEMAEKIQTGKLKLTQISKLTSAINQNKKLNKKTLSIEAKKLLLNKIESLSSLETDKLLAQEFQLPTKYKEQIIPQKDNTYYLGLKATEEQFQKIQKAKSLLSHVKHDATFIEVFEILCDKLMKAHALKDNSKTSKADYNIQPTATVAVSPPPKGILIPKTFKDTKTYRDYIPKTTQRMIFNRAQGCCEYISPLTGKRCGSTYQLQIDHILPLALGGHSHPENLRVLCRNHNLSEARRMGLDQNHNLSKVRKMEFHKKFEAAQTKENQSFE